MTKKYQINWPNWLVRDQRSVQFHVEANDYFGTLAAIIDLLEQKPELIGHPALQEVKKDLLILQEDYQIVSSLAIESTKKEKRIPKGKLTSQ
ncbi:MAG: hypothetical protein NT165_01695 [Candidatus Falkowbacteria bacterium]|nr:hypothetical protein [Candidatus Falkowbacteria bacterium]